MVVPGKNEKGGTKLSARVLGRSLRGYAQKGGMREAEKALKERKSAGSSWLSLVPCPSTSTSVQARCEAGLSQDAVDGSKSRTGLDRSTWT